MTDTHVKKINYGSLCIVLINFDIHYWFLKISEYEILNIDLKIYYIGFLLWQSQREPR